MVEVATQYTYESYKQYYWFALFRGKYYRLGKATFPFVTAILFALTVLSFTWLSSAWVSALATAGTALCVFLYGLAFVMPKRYVKRSPALFQSNMTLVFTEESVSTLQTGDMASGTSVLNYAALHKVYETKETFYLYLTPVQALLLPKRDIVKGTSEELRALLQAKLPKGKYVLCK